MLPASRASSPEDVRLRSIVSASVRAVAACSCAESRRRSAPKPHQALPHDECRGTPRDEEEPRHDGRNAREAGGSPREVERPSERPSGRSESKIGPEPAEMVGGVRRRSAGGKEGP